VKKKIPFLFRKMELANNHNDCNIYLKFSVMLEKIGKIANGKLLSSEEQKSVLGGKSFPGTECTDYDSCNRVGFCCSRGYCIDRNPGPKGKPIHADCE
jgi:hypothetical protein